jgi:hypothetical protein
MLKDFSVRGAKINVEFSCGCSAMMQCGRNQHYMEIITYALICGVPERSSIHIL